MVQWSRPLLPRCRGSPAARVLISVGAEVGAMPTVLHNLYIFWLGNRFFHDVLDFLYFTFKYTVLSLTKDAIMELTFPRPAIIDQDFSVV